MNKILTAVVFAISFSFAVSAQTPVDQDALAIINKMFAEMANHNPPAIAEIFTKEANLAAIIKTKEGKSVIRNFTGEAFSKNFAEKRGEIKEDMYAPKVEIDGDLAMIWGRYVFFVDGKVSHCGVNAFHLVRTDTGWRIANASSTIDPNACTDEEKERKP